MNYNSFTTDLYKSIGLEKNIFDFDLSQKELFQSDMQIKVTDRVEIKRPLVKEYQYKVNDQQNWECTTLFIPIKDKEAFIELLNTLLIEYKHTIEIISETEFECKFQGMAFITGKVQNNYLQVDVAKLKI